MLKPKILELLDQLLDLFEEKNKLIYKKLIYHHHELNNLIDEDELYSGLVDWITSYNIVARVDRRDKNILCGTRFEMEGEWLFNDLTKCNIETLWKWVDVIISDIVNETK